MLFFCVCFFFLSLNCKIATLNRICRFYKIRNVLPNTLQSSIYNMSSDKMTRNC